MLEQLVAHSVLCHDSRRLDDLCFGKPQVLRKSPKKRIRNRSLSDNLKYILVQPAAHPSFAPRVEASAPKTLMQQDYKISLPPRDQRKKGHWLAARLRPHLRFWRMF